MKPEHAVWVAERARELEEESLEWVAEPLVLRAAVRMHPVPAPVPVLTQLMGPEFALPAAWLFPGPVFPLALPLASGFVEDPARGSEPEIPAVQFSFQNAML